MRWIIAIITPFVLLAGARADEKQKFDPAAQAATIAPYIDEQTVGVVRVDVARLNVPAFFDRAAQIGFGDREPAQIARHKQIWTKWKADFLKAGGRDFWLVVTLAELPGFPAFIIAPLPSGADARAVAGLLMTGRADGPTSRPADPRAEGNYILLSEITTTLNNAVYSGSKAGLERLRANPPSPRPSLKDALAAAGDAGVQAALVPSPNAHRVIEEMFLGQSSAPDRDKPGDLRWAAAGLDLATDLSAKVTIQTRDNKSAQAMAAKIAAFLEEVRAGERDGPRRAVAKELFDLVLPAVQGNRLTLDLDKQRANKACALLGRVMRPAPTSTRRSTRPPALTTRRAT